MAHMHQVWATKFAPFLSEWWGAARASMFSSPRVVEHTYPRQEDYRSCAVFCFAKAFDLAVSEDWMRDWKTIDVTVLNQLRLRILWRICMETTSATERVGSAEDIIRRFESTQPPGTNERAGRFFG